MKRLLLAAFAILNLSGPILAAEDTFGGDKVKAEAAVNAANIAAVAQMRCIDKLAEAIITSSAIIGAAMLLKGPIQSWVDHRINRPKG
jgi:hypothetical protein